MSEATQYLFSHKELVEVLIKAQGIQEGIWSLSVEFGFGVSNMGADEEHLVPTAMLGVIRVGLQRTEKLTGLSVDAAVVNPATGDRPKE